MYTDASDDACGAQLSQEHDGQELPVAFLSHTFADTQWKWSTTELEAYGIYYAVTKWNYYLQGSDIVVHNAHKPLQKFLSGKIVNNKVNRWFLELAHTIPHLSGYQVPATRQLTYLSCLVDVKDIPATPTAWIDMLIISTPDGPATNTHSKTCNTADTTPADPMNTSTNDKVNTPPPPHRRWKGYS